ncbi:MAG: hypothetical protein PHW62_04455 [Candidatus Ratteibacteria bacterium]|nr:hypothetical protein [Candidatus Ratteibacteria bacterium]
MRLIPLTDRERLKEVCPFSLKTLYKWRSLGEHPDLTVKVAGKVCLCVDALEKMIEEGFKKQREKAEKLEAIRNELNSLEKT